MKIAFATQDQQRVDAHFGWAKYLAVYQIDAAGYQFVQSFPFGEDLAEDGNEDKLAPKLEGEILWIQSINRWENLVRPRLTWRPEANWRVSAGIDVFNGPVTGVIGRYRDRDRLYVETRYDF